MDFNTLYILWGWPDAGSILVNKYTVKIEPILYIKKEYKEYDKSLNLSWTYSGGKRYFKDRIVKKNGYIERAEAK